MKWYCHIKGQQYGPVDEATLRTWISEGRVLPNDLVWAEGMENWVKAYVIMNGTTAEIKGTGGMTPCKDIRSKARTALAGKWGMCALYMLGFFVITSLISAFTTYPPFFARHEYREAEVNWGQLLLNGPFTLGFAMFFLGVGRGGMPSFGTFFAGFKRFIGAFCLYWCMLVFVLLWMLLLIIPGIMAAYSYAMAYYVYADNPELGALGAIKRSKELMYGHRLKLFWLGLTFIGWGFLCILTFGIGFLWLVPYFNTALAVFYHDIQQPALADISESAPQGQPAESTVQTENNEPPMDLSRPINPQQ